VSPDAVETGSCCRLDATSAILRPVHPYRPLFVRSTDEASQGAFELRGLALVLILLGVVRLLPALATHEAFGVEPSLAVSMLALGALELSELRRRIRC